MSIPQQPVKLGFVPANRKIFSAELAAKARGQALETMRAMGLTVVVPDESQTEVGCVGDRVEAELCADLFRREEVQGIVIGAMNFGDEQAAAWVVRQARLDVPVFIFGCQEEETLTRSTARRDAFCGLLSIGEVLRQIGVKYTIAQTPICSPLDESFRRDIDWFARICRVVHGVRRARYGQIGARPESFWTCRYDEKQLQRLGPTTVVLDLSEVIAGARKISENDADLRQLIRDIGGYADTSKVTNEAVLRSARLELFLRRWKHENAVDGLAIQCWTSIQQNYGVCSCTTMSRLGDEGVPSACEADIIGTLSMHACQLASGTPAALADWNNLHNDDPELVNVWHCGVFPKAFARTQPIISIHEILAGSGAAPAEDAQGVVEFVAKASPVTLARITQDPNGAWKSVVVEGAIEDNSAVTFGSYGWCRVRNLDRLYRDVLLAHFPHHVAMTQSHVGNVLWEAFGNYLGFEVYHGEQVMPGVYTPRLPF